KGCGLRRPAVGCAALIEKGRNVNCEGRFLGRRPGLAMLLLLPLCGCLQTRDELTLEADGSGKVRLDTRVLVSSDLLSGMTMGMRMGGNEPIIYPPVSETEAKRLFPAKDFKVDVKTEKGIDTGEKIIAAVYYTE